MRVCTGQHGVLTNHPKQDIALSPVACRLAQAPHTLAPPSPPPRRRRQAGNAGHQMGCQPARVGWRTRGDQMSLVGHGCYGTAIPYSGWEAHRPASWGPGGLEAWIWISLGWAGPGQSRPRSTKVTRHHHRALQAGPHARWRLRLPAWSTMSCSTSSMVPAAAKMEGVRQQDWD